MFKSIDKVNITPRSISFPLILSILFVFTVPVLTANAQHLPEELTFPRVTDEEEGGGEGESGILNFSTDQNYSDESFTSANNILYTPTFGPVSLEQSVWYELRRDKQANTRHYLNTSGSLTRSLTNYKWLTPGLDWTPVAQYSTDRGSDNALATLDIGPTVGFDAWGVPLLVRGGMSGRRVDSLAARFRLGGHRSSVGAYGAFRIGSPDTLLPFAPVYFYTDALGRRIENSGMASLSSSALGALRVMEQDSVFLYGNFSLFNGREGYLEESADSRAMYFAETPWRIERGVEFTAGYKAARRYIFDPSIYYTVGEDRLEFPGDARKRDEKTLRQTLSGAVSTDSAAGMYYSGTLSFTWREHDKLFGREMPLDATNENVDSLDINLWDYAAFDPRTTHRLIIKLPMSLRLKYDFTLSRFLTEYPNYYINVNGRDTVTNRDDNDRRTLSHRIAMEYKNDSTRRVELFGELTDYDLVFLRAAKSSGSRTDNSQKIGLLADWSPINELLLSEAVYAEAKRGKFRYPEYHQEALQRPRYSRAVGSSLSSVWQATGMFGLSGKWNIKYSDYGYWYGREYMDDVLAKDSAARVDYYAVTSKSVYNTVDLSARLNVGEAMLEAGNVFTIARDRNYEGGNYIITNGNGFSTKPYLNAAVSLYEKAEISAYVSRTFVKGDRTLGYWDFRLQAEGQF